MLKSIAIALLAAAATAQAAAPAKLEKAAVAAKPKIITSVTTCTACQEVVDGIEDAVARGKLGTYDDLTDGFCATTFDSEPILRDFCTTVVAGGKYALGGLLRENDVPTIGTCVALGACPAPACPDTTAWQLGSNTWQDVIDNPNFFSELCAVCTAAPVDVFGAIYLQDTLSTSTNGVHICSAGELRFALDGVQAPTGNLYWTNQAERCTERACFDYQYSSGLNIFSRRTNNFQINSNAGVNVLVEEGTGGNAQAIACLCANKGNNIPRRVRGPGTPRPDSYDATDYDTPSDD